MNSESNPTGLPKLAEFTNSKSLTGPINLPVAQKLAH